jgi:hypothetical protein
VIQAFDLVCIIALLAIVAASYRGRSAIQLREGARP